MGLSIFIILTTAMYIIFIYCSKESKQQIMCIERCNKKKCEYCIDKEQCNIK